MEEGHKSDYQEASKEVQEAAQDIAHDPQLIRKRINLVNQLGVSGERRAIGIVSSVVDSRLVEPDDNGTQWTLGAKISSTQGTGKSHLVGVCLRIQDASTYMRISSGSPKSLYNLQEGLKNRALFVEEASGIPNRRDGDFAYILRQVLSDGRAVHLTLERARNGTYNAVEKLIEGPMSLVTTTILPDLEAQLQSRLLAVTLNESSRQTQKIIKQLAAIASGKVNGTDRVTVQAWREYHRCLEPARLVIPFAPKIATRLGSTTPLPTEARRAFKRILSLTMAVAIANQRQRPRDGNGRLRAYVADYDMARQMLDEIFEDGLAEQNGQYQARLAFIKNAKSPVQIKDLVKEWQVSKKSVSQLLTRAREDGFVVWCNNSGNPFANPADERTAKHSGQAFVKATTPTSKPSSVGNLLPSPYELTKLPEWDKGGREWDRYNLHL